MTVHDEAFDTREAAERVYYDVGVFLDAQDMRAEQAYHRGRLTRVLNYLHGAGTAAGLRVSHDAAEDEIRVAPGIAVDRLGRLIEVPRPACVRVDRWLAHHRDMVLRPDDFTGESAIIEALTADQSEVVVDVYVRFAVCARGRTPAFATGPFDAIDAAVPHRLRDSYELSLELRGGDSGPLPASPWPARTPEESLEQWRTRLREAVLDGWRHGSASWQDDRLLPDSSTIGVADPTSVFLARARVPVVVPASGIPERALIAGAPAPVLIDDSARQLVYSSAALLHWLDALALELAT